MNTIDLILLSCGGIGLAAVTGFAFWIKVRVVSFKADILEVYVDLRTEARRLGLLNDPAYLEMSKRVYAVAAMADTFSVPTAVYLVRMGASHEVDGRLPQSKNEELNKAIREAMEKSGNRFVYYITKQTLLGLLLWLVLRILPRAKKEVQAETVESMERVRVIRETLHAGHC